MHALALSCSAEWKGLDRRPFTAWSSYACTAFGCKSCCRAEHWLSDGSWSSRVSRAKDWEAEALKGLQNSNSHTDDIRHNTTGYSRHSVHSLRSSWHAHCWWALISREMRHTRQRTDWLTYAPASVHRLDEDA